MRDPPLEDSFQGGQAAAADHHKVRLFLVDGFEDGLDDTAVLENDTDAIIGHAVHLELFGDGAYHPVPG